MESKNLDSYMTIEVVEEDKQQVIQEESKPVYVWELDKNATPQYP